MTHRLTTGYDQKIVVIEHIIVQVILENVVTCFFLGHSVLSRM